MTYAQEMQSVALKTKIDANETARSKVFNFYTKDLKEKIKISAMHGDFRGDYKMPNGLDIILLRRLIEFEGFEVEFNKEGMTVRWSV